MKNLVSRNPVLRFKLGRKIIKAEEGAVARWQRRIKSGINGIGRALDMTFNPNNTLFGSLKIYNFARTAPNRIINSLVVENYTPTNGGTTNNRLRNRQLNNLNTAKQNTYKTPELKGSKEAYLNRLQQQGFTAKPTNKVDTTQTLKSLLKPLSKLLNNIWIKGYNRHPEITNVRAMLQKLWDLGLLKGSKFGVDGKWGKDTEAAYLKYLNLKNIPTMNLPTNVVSPAELMGIYTEETKPLHQKIGLVLKQGGSLFPSRNPVKRFKSQRKGL